jgi:hypothetical protein
MKVEYTLTKTEYDSIEQMFEDIPINLCDYVKCPECEGDACVNCPLNSISEQWYNGLTDLVGSVNERLKAIKPKEED